MKTKQKTFCFDIDRTLCEAVNSTGEYADVKPKKDVIDFVNQLFQAGNIVLLYTGRHSQQFLVTQEWLKKNNVQHHHVFFGKPVADVYIDDLAVRYTNLDEVKKELKKLELFK